MEKGLKSLPKSLLRKVRLNGLEPSRPKRALGPQPSTDVAESAVFVGFAGT